MCVLSLASFPAGSKKSYLWQGGVGKKGKGITAKKLVARCEFDKGGKRVIGREIQYKMLYIRFRGDGDEEAKQP